MILVDTSVWVDHFKRNNAPLQQLLENDDIYCHELIIGELACGNLENRKEILESLANLPQALLAHHQEVLVFMDRHFLYGKGIGWIDAHLLASAFLSHARLWTRDKRLKALAQRLHISF